MKVTLLGAAGDVTGSAYYIENGSSRVLLDFGMFQGMKRADELNILPKQIDIARLDAVVLTHAHLDHTGRLPLLTKAGYKGPIYATPASIDLTGLILKDSAKIQTNDIERTNRKRALHGEPPLAPIYGAADVDAVLKLLRPLPYDGEFNVAPNISVQMVEAGHILGSASIGVMLDHPTGRRTVVFSGDIGPKGAPVLRDAQCFVNADVVFLESTYGDRDHRPLNETVEEFRTIVKTAVERRGKILIPAFAVGRTQQLVYFLSEFFRSGAVPPFPIYIDSPMAVEASKIYNAHPELYDVEADALRRSGEMLAGLKMVNYSVSAQESMALNDLPGPCMIIAGSGMCNAGRILHHLRHNLGNPETSIIMVGFQSEGTIGRQIVDRRPEVSIFGEKHTVRAAVHTLGGFSAHAGQTELLDWLGCAAHAKPRVYLTHGEAKGRVPLAAKILERFGLTAQLPLLNDVVTIV